MAIFLSFKMVVTYPETLLKSLSSSCSFSVDSMRFVTYMRLVLWPRMWSRSIMVSVLHAFQKNIDSTVVE